MPYSEVLIRWTNIDWNLTQRICIMPNETSSLCVFWLFGHFYAFCLLCISVFRPFFDYFCKLFRFRLFFAIWIFSASFFSFRRKFFVNFFSLLTNFFRIWQAHKNCCHRQHRRQHRQQHLLRSLRHFLKQKNTNSIQMVILAAYIHLRHIQIHLVLCRVTMWVQNIKKHFHYQFRP